LMILVMVAVPILRVANYFLMPGSRQQVALMFHTACDSVAAGVLLGELLRSERHRAALMRLATNRWVVFGSVAFLVVASPILSLRFKGAYWMTFGRTLELGLLAILVTASVFVRGTWLFALLNWRPLAYVGGLSYSLYVWNNLFFYPEKGWWFSVFPLNYACIVAAALASHYLVERPFLRLKNRFQRGTPPLPAINPSSA